MQTATTIRAVTVLCGLALSGQALAENAYGDYSSADANTYKAQPSLYVGGFYLHPDSKRSTTSRGEGWTVGVGIPVSYTTSNVTSCSATGSDATGVWATDPVPTPGSTPVTKTAVSTPMTVARSYVYTLTCTGPGGTVSAAPVTVTATSAAPGFLPVKGQAPASAGLFVSKTSGTPTPASLTMPVAPGGNLYFSWATSNAMSCVPSSNEPAPSAWATTTTDTVSAVGEVDVHMACVSLQ